MSDETMAALLRYDDERRKLMERWKREPPPEGFQRCDGYYGCGALTRAVSGSAWDCSGCGRTTLAIGFAQ